MCALFVWICKSLLKIILLLLFFTQMNCISVVASFLQQAFFPLNIFFHVTDEHLYSSIMHIKKSINISAIIKF